jgi:hypothetical protein
VARVVAYVPDLLFGSNVLGALRAAGHDAVLASDPDSVRRELAGAQALVVDLTADPAHRIAELSTISYQDVKTLAFYSHVEAHVRVQAVQAGFDLVIPRSRMAREGASLVTRLVEGGS